jgi:hypothetical protein
MIQRLEKNKAVIKAAMRNCDFLFSCFVKMDKPIKAMIHSKG